MDRPKNKEAIIIRLIKDHLIHTRLIQGLENLGIDAYIYHLHLGETIFELMEINDKQDALFKKYIRWCGMASTMKFSKYPELLDEYATKLYGELMKNRKG